MFNKFAKELKNLIITKALKEKLCPRCLSDDIAEIWTETIDRDPHNGNVLDNYNEDFLFLECYDCHYKFKEFRQEEYSFNYLHIHQKNIIKEKELELERLFKLNI